jgi:hypothetical protein
MLSELRELANAADTESYVISYGVVLRQQRDIASKVNAEY